MERLFGPAGPRPGVYRLSGLAPDFHPRLAIFCTLETSVVNELVSSLIDQIQGKNNPHVAGVAEQMTDAFIALYERMIQDYQNQINALPSGSDPSGLQATITQLKQYVKQLQQFLKSLSS